MEEPMTTSPSPQPQRPLVASRRPMKLFVAALVLLLLATIVAVGLSVFKSKPAPIAATNTTPKVAQVQINDKGFVPSTLNITPGTVVEWVSNDPSTSHVVASNPYPSHSDLPTLVSGQLGNGAKYRFAFPNVGIYKYHDDLNPTLNGTIVVK